MSDTIVKTTRLEARNQRPQKRLFIKVLPESPDPDFVRVIVTHEGFITI